METVTIQIIYDNCKANQELQEGWGFSALIKTPSRQILFDTGNDLQAFISNTKKMHISHQEITDVVFSHKHADHITGCYEILSELSPQCRVYIPKGFPSKKIPKHLATHVVKHRGHLDENISSLVLKGGFLLYEQALILHTDKGLVVITGCAHPGITTILQETKKLYETPIHLVLGGFHLFREEKGSIQPVIDSFRCAQVKKVAPCHCSGDYTIEQFEKAYHQDFLKIGTGSILTL
jgi:7,8-dihydropterin-6-yl-methyl-4-(beta-D-ribofuranosyl)aminobenzene 5'-phosphate synthase